MSTSRTSRTTVTFRRPFMLPSIGAVQPAGSYVVETDEEQLPSISALAYRRTATLLFLPQHAESQGMAHVVNIDPRELDAMMARDAADE